MIGRFADSLADYAQRLQSKCILATFTLGAIGVLIGCSSTTVLTPTLPTSIAATPKMPDQGYTPPSRAPLPSHTAAATLSNTTTALQPTARPTGYPERSTQGDETGQTPSMQHPSPTSGHIASRQPPDPTLGPPATPVLSPPTPTSAGSDISVYTGQVTLLTYPYRDFLREEQDTLYGMQVQRLDRAAYEAAAPSPSPQNYHTLMIENTYLRLTFLPELGGRLYSAVVKPTGQEIFYHNSVVKPSRYGPLLPVEDNWWLGVGGMEWAFPVQEHGYAWYLPWTYDVTSSPQRVTVTLRDSTEPGRIRAEVRVTLPANSATFSIQPRLINGTDHTLPVQFWLNATLAPGNPSVTPDTHIIVPVNQVVVHSRGEEGWDLPSPRTPMPWPVAAGHDLSRYDQWANYLGFFIPHMQTSFMATYNPAADLAVARIVPPGQIPGHKFFAFGLNFSDRSYTDDDSQYAEMWGGANPSFWPEDDIQLPPGGTIEWRETWWPLAGLGGLTFANEHVAFNLLNDSALRILSARPTQVTLLLSAGGAELLRTPLALSPNQPVEQPIPAASGSPIQIQFIAANGDLIADYQSSLHSASTSP